MPIVLIGAAIVVSVLAAASARLPSLVSTLLVAYLAFVSNIGLVTWGLSPLRAVTRAGVGGAEAGLLVLALAVWWLRGRPRLPLAGAERAARQIAGDPVTLLFLAAIGALLAYELVLALAVPPNNWDSLTYHLPRAAAWFQHGGIYWISNPPTPNFNEFPPLAEQEVLFFFVATHSPSLFAVPQYLAQLAVLAAVYGASRRLGYAPRAAAAGSCLLATFSFFALQATTAQNDLFAAALPIAAACLMLGGSRLEVGLGGAAATIALGAKPTTALVLPVIALLVLARGRRAVGPALAGGAAGFLGIGMWAYVLNLIHTGNVFGTVGWTRIGTLEEQPLRGGAISHSIDLTYQLLDIAVLTNRQIHWLAIAGAVCATGVGLYALRRSRLPVALLEACLVAVPFCAPLLVIHASDLVSALANAWGAPVRGHFGNLGLINRTAGGAAFGCIGAVVLIATPVVTVIAVLRRRADVRQLVLAMSLPLFVVLLAEAKYNWYLTRFLMIPTALSAPLFAQLFRRRSTTAAFAVVASIAVALIVTQDPARPLSSRFGRPWQLTQVDAAALSGIPATAGALVAYERLVPPHACVGAVLDPNEPAYLLSLPNLEHPVFYLSVDQAVADAYRHDLNYVVITKGTNRWAAGSFRAGRWRIRPLGTYWLLAIGPRRMQLACAGTAPA